MALEQNIELLGQVPIFEGLTQEQLAAIAGKGKKTYFAEGAVILRAGEKSDTAYLILTGSAATEPEAESGLKPDNLEAGTLLGEIAMLVESTQNLTIKAKVRVRALAIERSQLLEVMEADPSIAHHLSEKLVDRLIVLANDLRHIDARFAALELTLDHTLAAIG